MPMESLLSDLEGTLLRDKDLFPYFMLVAFEASGIIRFAVLLLFWPVIRLLEASGRSKAGFKLTMFVALAGVPVKEIEMVGKAVLSKFLYDDLDLEAWRVFNNSDRRRVVVTKMPRVMVEWFVKQHLLADEVIGSELVANRFGWATGFAHDNDLASLNHFSRNSISSQDDKRCDTGNYGIRPPPVIFHDGRLVPRPTPYNALLILLWFPFGLVLVAIRIIIGLPAPLWLIPFIVRMFGGKVVVKGKPPPIKTSQSNSGVLFVSTHRTLMDPTILSLVLQRRIPAATYSISRFSEIISPIPIVRLSRVREVDAERVKRELSKGDLIVCPEGTTCREPFLLRFSALFAELTDQIVPVAMNYRVPFFHATTARGWKALDPIFFLLNPCGVYEITFLEKLPLEATCSSGKTPQEVANYVQGILAAALGFECTNLTRKDKYRVLTGKDGLTSSSSSSS